MNGRAAAACGVTGDFVPMPFTLRAYEPSDFETLYAIDQDCYPRGIAYSRRTLRWFLEQPGADCVLASAGSDPESMIAGFIVTEAEGPAAHVVTLDVVESHRRTGIGSALLVSAEQRLAARGVRRIALETATSNEAAVAFWQRHGYRSHGVLPRYYLGRLDAFAMTKPLAPAPEA